MTQLADPTEQEIKQMREEIEEAQKEKSRAYHRKHGQGNLQRPGMKKASGTGGIYRKKEIRAPHPGGAGSGGKAACAPPGMAEGLAGETQGQPAGEATEEAAGRTCQVPKGRGRPHAGGNGAACGIPPEKSRPAESKAEAEESGAVRDRLSHTGRIKAHQRNVYNWPWNMITP